MRELREKCGVFGVYGAGLGASRLTFFGLFALQHRGQESSGIASSDGQTIMCHRDMGLVAHVFNEETMARLTGHSAIGHNRYSTFGSSTVELAQPVLVHDAAGEVLLALAHNGNLPIVEKLVAYLAAHQVTLPNASDSMLAAEAIGVAMREGKSVEDAVAEIFPLLQGAFSMVVLTKDKLIAFRDAHGIRPLSLGKLNGGYIVTSETCAFHPIGAEALRDVEPGEMIIVSDQGLESRTLTPGQLRIDAFEFVYFARPDSTIAGRSVYEVRKHFGELLAQQSHIEADIVIPVPETAVPVAVGYARATGTPLEMGLIKNRYIHRTFIEPEQHVRDQGVKVKLTPIAEEISGKRVVLMDDSIVRGTTSRQIVKMLFDTGAKEVHFLVSSPPVKYPDFYGIDTPRQEKLLASTKSVEEIAEYLGVTSLVYLSYENLIRGIGLPESSLCTSCFTGDYPIDIGANRAQIRFGV